MFALYFQPYMLRLKKKKKKVGTFYQKQVEFKSMNMDQGS